MRLKSCLFLSILSLFLLSSISSLAQSYTYLEKSGDNEYHYDYDIQKMDGKIKIKVIRREGEHLMEDQAFILNQQLHTLKWVFIRTQDNTHVTAELKGDRVFITGVRDGDEIEDDHDLGDYPWIQLWPMNIGLEQFINSSDEEIRFWAFGTEKPGDLDLAKFVAEKEEKEMVRMQGNTDVLALRVNITLSGWKSLFWEGDFFFRDSDNRIIKYDGGGAPGKPDSITTLISED